MAKLSRFEQLLYTHFPGPHSRTATTSRTAYRNSCPSSLPRQWIYPL